MLQPISPELSGPRILILSPESLSSSARNSLPGKVMGVAENWIYAKIQVNCGSDLLLSAALTRQNVERLVLSSGTRTRVRLSSKQPQYTFSGKNHKKKKKKYVGLVY